MRHKIPLNVTIEVTNGPRVQERSRSVRALPDFEITRTVVTAKSRRLSVKYSIEIDDSFLSSDATRIYFMKRNWDTK